MLQGYKLPTILFLDIETVSQHPKYSGMDERFQKLWDKKANKNHVSEEKPTPESVYDRAALYPEFGKVACITVGFHDTSDSIRIFTYYSHDEKQLLTDFATLLNKSFFEPKNHKLCGHNGKGFDFPFLIKRMIIQGIKLPKILNIGNLKPWETPFLDTMEYWKAGNYKGNESLDLISACLGIPTPKNDIDGSKVGEVYWKGNDLNRIVEYCEKDVIALIQVARRMSYLDLIQDSKINIIK